MKKLLLILLVSCIGETVEANTMPEGLKCNIIPDRDNICLQGKDKDFMVCNSAESAEWMNRSNKCKQNIEILCCKESECCFK